MPLPKEKIYTIEDYYMTGEDEHVELIDGVLYDMAPPNRFHQKISMRLGNHIENYINENNGDCEVYAAPFGVQLSEDDESTIVEPDISVICDKNKLTDKGCVGAPDWIIEIVSPSNPAHDYIRKLKLYLRAGVREYWIVDPLTSDVTVYDLSDKAPIPEYYSFDDTVKAGIYKDLYIDFKEITEEE